MKNFFVVTLIFLSQFTLLTAQDSINIPEFGRVEVAELRLKDCSFSPGASAVNLLKYSEIELDIYPDGTTELITLTRYRIKIFNENGYQFAKVTIPFSRDEDVQMRDIEAIVFNLDENGQVSAAPVRKEDIFRDQGGKNDYSKTIKFTFPGVKPGSVIEYQVLRRHKAVYGVPAVYFQDDIPNQLAIYNVARPVFSKLQKRVIANFPVKEVHMLDDSQGKNRKQLRDFYVMRNVPAFKSEPFMGSPYDYMYRIDFLLDLVTVSDTINPWQPFNKRLLNSRYFGGAFDGKMPGVKALVDSVKKLDADDAKIRSVCNYVKRHVKWDGTYYPYASALDHVWDEGTGSSAEINLSILNLLRRCKLKCYPVLYSTRYNGTVDYSFTDIDQFNTVNIAVVNGDKLNLLDGTKPHLSHRTPPFNVANRTGLLIDPDSLKTINIDFDRKLIWDTTFVTAAVASNGLLKGTIVKKYFDLARWAKLRTEEEDDENAKDLKPIGKTNEEIKIDSAWQQNGENEMLPLVENSRFHHELQVTNDFYFINPFLFSNLTKTPFTDSARISDIDFGAASASTIKIAISLPRGLKPEELPKNREIFNEDSTIAYLYRNEIKNDTIYVTTTLEIKKPIFENKDYPSVKKTFDKIYALLSNQILLRKEH